jgi:hypothetical protein
MTGHSWLFTVTKYIGPGPGAPPCCSEAFSMTNSGFCIGSLLLGLSGIICGLSLVLLLSMM